MDVEWKWLQPDRSISTLAAALAAGDVLMRAMPDKMRLSSIRRNLTTPCHRNLLEYAGVLADLPWMNRQWRPDWHSFIGFRQVRHTGAGLRWREDRRE